jgi:hypothetical protein
LKKKKKNEKELTILFEQFLRIANHD